MLTTILYWLLACSTIALVLVVLNGVYKQAKVVANKDHQRYEYQIEIQRDPGESLCFRLYSERRYEDLNSLIEACDTVSMDESFFTYAMDGKKVMVPRGKITLLCMKRIERSLTASIGQDHLEKEGGKQSVLQRRKKINGMDAN